MTIIFIITLVVTNIYLLVREYNITKNIKFIQKNFNWLQEKVYSEESRLEKLAKELGYEKITHISSWVKTKKK